MSKDFENQIRKELEYLDGEEIGEDNFLYSAVIIGRKGGRLIPTFTVMAEEGKVKSGDEKLYKAMRTWAEEAMKLVIAEGTDE